MSSTATQTVSKEPKVKTTLNFWLPLELGGHNEYQIGVTDYFRRKFDNQVRQILFRGKADFRPSASRDRGYTRARGSVQTRRSGLSIYQIGQPRTDFR